MLIGLTSLWFAPPTRNLPLCTADDAIQFGINTIGKLIAHGTPRKLRACRAVSRPRPLPWVPLLLAAPLLLAMHRELRRQDDAEREAVRQAMLDTAASLKNAAGLPSQPLSANGPVPTVVLDDPDAKRLPPPAAWPEQAALSARSQALLEARRQQRPSAAAARFGAWADFTLRFPALSVGVACYLGGWVLILAGSDLPVQAARALTPAALRHQFHDWPALGLWLSALAALTAGIVVPWWRDRNK
jgi:hypothetical protein